VDDFYDKAAELYDRQFGILQLIILLMVLLSVVNTMSGTIFEEQPSLEQCARSAARTVRFSFLILVEGAVLGLAGSVPRNRVGCWSQTAVSMSAYRCRLHPVPTSRTWRGSPSSKACCCGAFLIGLAATVLGSIPAGLRSSRMRVVDALREARPSRILPILSQTAWRQPEATRRAAG